MKNLHLEHLESRCTPTASLSGTTLTITPEPFTSTTIYAAGAGVIVWEGMHGSQFNAPVTKIVYLGTPQNDFLVNNTSIATVAYGFGGRDRLVGGYGHNEIHGGDGDDLLYARSVDTEIWGDGGADLYLAMAGSTIHRDSLDKN